MSSYPSPLDNSLPGSRGAALLLRLLLVAVASGLTAALWFGASAGASRQAVDAGPARAGTPVRITLPTVVVTGRRLQPDAAPTQVVAGAASNCGPAPAALPPQ